METHKNKPESISPEMLAMLREAQANLDASPAMAIKQFTVAHIFRAYGLRDGDVIDAQTGKITYGPSDNEKKEPAP